MSKKLVVILGPTASGKTKISLKLAKKFNGEIVSADSRQVYKGLDIGSGKITKKEMKGIPHYLLSIASPKRIFTVAQFQRLALKAINKIFKRKKIPFLVGGTAFYIQSVVDGIVIPKVKPDWKLRKKLAQKTNKELFSILKKLDPQRARVIDKNNPRRLIRALEIAIKLKKPIPPLKKIKPTFEFLMLGLKGKNLKENIKKRLLKRLPGKGSKKSIISETRKLKKEGLSWKRLEGFGLEYKYAAQYLQKKITYKEMIEKIQKESERFAKRQMTWFKKDKRIRWIKKYKEAEILLKKFLK